ncbi:MAG: prohibitin family protein, partial [Armatimonadota bacterium]
MRIHWFEPEESADRARDAVQRIRRRMPRATWLLILVFASVVLWKAVVTVGAGERAAVFNRITGVEKRQLGEGWHLLVPFIEIPERYDVKVRTYTMSAKPSEGDVQGDDSLLALTADGQPVTVDMSVRFHPDPTEIWQLHEEIGPDYVNRVVRPQVRSVARMVIAEYPVTDVYSERRQEIQDKISQELTEMFGRNHLVFDALLVRDVEFSKEFQAAVEAKQVAEQEYLKMEYVLDRARTEAQQKIVAAEGDAESIRLRGEALRRNPRLIDYEYAR